MFMNGETQDLLHLLIIKIVPKYDNQRFYHQYFKCLKKSCVTILSVKKVSHISHQPTVGTQLNYSNNIS